MANNYKLASFRIVKLDCEVDPPANKEQITLTIENSFTSFRPTNSSVKKGKLKTETFITSPDCDTLHIRLVAESVFSFDAIPEDFDKELKEHCYPLSRKKLQEAVKVITGAIGISPIDIGSSDD